MYNTPFGTLRKALPKHINNPISYLSEANSTQNNDVSNTYEIDENREQNIRTLVEFCNTNLVPESSMDGFDESDRAKLLFCNQQLQEYWDLPESLEWTEVGLPLDFSEYKNHELKQRIFLIFDLCIIGNLENKISLIQRMNIRTSTLRREINEYLKWTEDKGDVFINWLSNYQASFIEKDKTIPPNTFSDKHLKDRLEAHALYTYNKNTILFKYFFSQARKAWNQKAHRDKNSEKISRTYSFSKDTVVQLDALYEHLDTSRTKLLEELIKEAHNKYILKSLS